MHCRLCPSLVPSRQRSRFTVEQQRPYLINLRTQCDICGEQGKKIKCQFSLYSNFIEIKTCWFGEFCLLVNVTVLTGFSADAGLEQSA